MTLIHVSLIANSTPLELWGGWDGKGFGGLMYLGTGTRAGGLASWVMSSRDGSVWRIEIQPAGVETVNKIRDGQDPNGSGHKLWAFLEGADPGIGLLGVRDEGGGWDYESGIPLFGNVVGGRGLAVNGGLYVGGSRNWQSDRDGFVQRKNGGWADTRAITPGLAWELEFDGEGHLWEFWNGFGGAGEVHTFRGGATVPDPPGGDISHAVWFDGAMYVTGQLTGANPGIYRSSGGSWEQVHTLSCASGDHLAVNPKGGIWATGQGPLAVAMSQDGSTWEDVDAPALETGRDTNHLTGLCAFRGRMWVAAKSPDGIVILREPGALEGAGDDAILQLQIS